MTQIKPSVTIGKTLLTYYEVADIDSLIGRLVTFARHRKFQYKQVSRGILTFQKSGTWLMLTGLSASIRISVSIDSGRTELVLGDYAKEFTLKQFVFMTAFAIGVPLTAWSFSNRYPIPVALIMTVPIYGTFGQYRLIEDVKAEIDDYFSERLAKSSEE
jgi:hypothetical protein